MLAPCVRVWQLFCCCCCCRVRISTAVGRTLRIEILWNCGSPVLEGRSLRHAWLVYSYVAGWLASPTTFVRGDRVRCSCVRSSVVRMVEPSSQVDLKHTHVRERGILRTYLVHLVLYRCCAGNRKESGILFVCRVVGELLLYCSGDSSSRFKIVWVVENGPGLKGCGGKCLHYQHSRRTVLCVALLLAWHFFTSVYPHVRCATLTAQDTTIFCACFGQPSSGIHHSTCCL